MGPDSALSSDDVNYLIYRYLIEAGFSHSAFVFGCESTVNKTSVDGKDVPIGALVTFIQRGFQFMELEANLNEQGTDVYGKYLNLTASDILTKDIKELREMARKYKLEESNQMTPLTSIPNNIVQQEQPMEDIKTLTAEDEHLKVADISSEIPSSGIEPHN